ncbi:uncharacterized protein GIQ15_04750 [Arthroderma uncinatum]|uniref:uncharacterized protein n=1 Tax=Arthroderma uncinatum TaxID=74035 RepID=UPI00144ABDD6|nr:uncharacterized protein GIQ15_04750 [Arthroderma uncinatum]KAF3481991.1 hypothetical protein GIQ15_04750 [Arthroderma uncinatum]
MKLPMAIRYWQGEGAAIDCFVKAPRSLITAVTQATGAQIDIEASNQRIRVTSIEPWQADNAMERLSNLQRFLSLMVSPQVANILHVGSATEFRLRILPYKSLNDIALRRVLVDGPESRVISHLHDMFVTVMETLDPETRELTVSQNIAAPPRFTEQRKGRARIWGDFKFPQLGDASVLPNPGANTKEGIASKSSSSIKDDSVHEEVAVESHPWLSHEKASYVNKWVTDGVQAGAIGPTGSEPNSTLPPEPSAEVTDAPKPPWGLKRRQPLPSGNNRGVSKTPPVIEKPTCINSAPKITVQPAATLPVSVMPPSFNSAAYGHPKPSPSRQLASKSQAMNQRSWERGRETTARKLPTLLDTSIAETGPTVSSIPPMAFTQILIPLQPTLRPSLASPVVNPSVSVPSNVSDAFGPQARMEENKDPAAGKETVRESNEESNEERLRKLKLSTKMSSRAFAGLKPAIIEGEESTRVFHRTMGQGAPVPAPSAKRETKAEQKARRQAALSEAWGSTPVAPPCKPASPPEPSQWKKAQLAKEETSDVESVKDLFNCLQPILDAVQHFTGTLTMEIQLGLILTNSVPKIHIGRTLDVKTWNPHFRPRHGLLCLTTVFNNMLTTSGADVDYFFKLGDGSGPDVQLYFEPEPQLRQVFYEFHCQTKDNDTLIVLVDEAGAASVNRPDVVLGAVNVHFPLNIWDLQATVKGSQEYPTTPESGISMTVKCLVDNLYVPPDRSRVIMYTRVPEDSALRVTKILMRRTTRHKYIGKPLFDKSKLPDFTNEQSVFLQITEVQRLVSGNTPTDKTAIRARAVSPEEMVDTSRLWFEASIVSPAIEKIFETNKYLTVGERVDSWFPDDLLGIESHLGGNVTEESRPVEFLTMAERAVGSSGIGSLFRLARKVVEKIDVIGWGNHTATFTLDKYPSPSASAPAGPFDASQTEGGKAKASEMNKSVAPTQVTQGEYW